MPNQLVDQGLNLLIFGMGIVAVFLTLLVLATTVMSKVVQRFFPEPLFPQPKLSASGSDFVSAHSVNLPDAHTLEIIKQAVRQHREKK